jgi:hypothetical protein
MKNSVQDTLTQRRMKKIEPEIKTEKRLALGAARVEEISLGKNENCPAGKAKSQVHGKWRTHSAENGADQKTRSATPRMRGRETSWNPRETRVRE